MKLLQSIFFLLLFLPGSCFSQKENITQCGIIDSLSAPGNDTIYKFPDINAAFPGGRAEMNKFICTHLSFSCTNGFHLTGKCYLQFVVQEMGSISDIKVLRGVPDCKECDQEAINVVQSMPK